MLPALLLLLATHELFPSDYTPSQCALEVSCISFPDSSMKSAGFQFLGLDLDPVWLEKHGPEMKAAMAPLCRKHATCQTYPTNSYMFCDDVLTAEAHTLCGKMFPRDKNAQDADQCKAWIEVYLMGVDQNAINTWKSAQACAKKQPAAVHAKPLDVWMAPESIPYDYKGQVTFYAVDPDTHVPVLARVLLPNQTIFAPANPSGETATYYPFPTPFSFKYTRVPNQEGHTDAIPPMITISAAGYPDTSFRLPAVVPKAVVEMTPATLHAGKNEVTVVAHDSINQKTIDGRVMMGSDEIGFTNQPITIEVKANRPEIWLKPYLDRYSDVVIVPAEK
jgi:hypothetical protein